MKRVEFNCYKISEQLAIKELGSSFGISERYKRKEYIILKDNQINEILKYKTEDTFIFVFENGIIVFVNIDENERMVFLDYISKLFVKINYNQFNKYNEMQSVIIKSNKAYLEEYEEISFRNTNEFITEMVKTLATSVTIEKMEDKIKALLIDAEEMIDFLQYGRMNIGLKKVYNINYKLSKFRFESMKNIALYSHSKIKNDKYASDRKYEKLYKYYELEERALVIKNKVKELNNISKKYNSYILSEKMQRSYIFEIMLLMIFPLVSLIGGLFE